MNHQQRYEQTEKGKAARRRARDKWNAKRRAMRAAKKLEQEAAPRVISARVSSVFDLGQLAA